MIALDHIAIWSGNLYRTTIELSRLTGIGSADGGYFPGLGLGQKIISLGGGVYLEIESIVDHRMILERDPVALELERQTDSGDCFAGLCLRSDELTEIEAFAAHRGVEVSAEIAGGKALMVPGQKRGRAAHAPDFLNSWLKGKPNIYYVEGLENHSSILPPQPGTGDVVGLGVTSIELGGSEASLRSWLGELDPAELGLDIRYNGLADGLYAVGFDSTAGPQEIRLPPITLPAARSRAAQTLLSETS
ncbi:VOC family protein [Herbiconiux ginsengi]|uniref:Glyoxalase-like domain-containing protein n=1 Tax=Herbiconiux ginsengi TaxID=381665 RepID=A0A1H3LH37_9MICO|nr:VOC family protein [Herbiconiux ginsengi]SDY63165.1 Glyoxalase-like domain-containing protein [Herbiconiux ginsengi]